MEESNKTFREEIFADVEDVELSFEIMRIPFKDAAAEKYKELWPLSY